ncbi:hypothetical protein BH10BAC2_BH10BAC2_38130 [soil metagenome]
MKKITFLLFITSLPTAKQVFAQSGSGCNTYENFHRITQTYINGGTSIPVIHCGPYTQGPPENQTLLYNCFDTIDERTGAFVNIFGIVNGPGDTHAYGEEALYSYSTGYYPTPIYRQVDFWCSTSFVCHDVTQHVPATNPSNPSSNWSSPTTWIDNAVPPPSEPTILLNKSINLNINLSLSGQLLISSTGSAIVSAGITITNPNALVRTNGLFQNNGILKGAGKIAGSLTNNGTIDPGNTIGAFSIRDNYTATANAVHKIEISGINTYDTIKVGQDLGTTGGIATLNGTLNVSLLNGYTPLMGSTFKIFTFNSSTSVFATENLPLLPGGLCWSIHYNPMDVTLEVVNTCLPFITIADKSLPEGNTGATQTKLKVSLSSASTSTVTVNYTTADSTATAGSDYVAKTGKLTFSPGQISKTIPILINGDTQVEPNEKIKVLLSVPVNATIADKLGIITVRNDDAAAFAANIIKNDAVITGVNTLKVLPNPAKNKITISGLATGTSNYIQLTDLNGHSLLKKKVSGSNETIDISAYSSGIYIFRYFDGNKVQQLKVVKE